MTKDGLSQLWNQLVKDGELAVGDVNVYNTVGALAKKGKSLFSLNKIYFLSMLYMPQYGALL